MRLIVLIDSFKDNINSAIIADISLLAMEELYLIVYSSFAREVLY